MVATNGDQTVRPGMMRTFAGLLADRLGLASRLGWSYDGSRNLYDMLGYKTVLTYQDYLARYERQDLAHRCVHIYPDLTWSQPPLVREVKSEQVDTAFETAWASLVLRLKVYRYLKRVDLLANLGHYAVLLIGLRGQANLALPAQPVRGPEDVLYVQPYSEASATVAEWEDNAGHVYYGRPRRYHIQTGLSSEVGPRGVPARRLLVHASRVLHVAEDVLEDDIYGTPRLKPIYNRLEDVDKLVGMSAEGYARDHRRRIAALLRDGYELNEEDRETYKEQVEKYGMGWTDFLSLGGMDVQQLSGQSVSPKDHFDVQVACIAAGLQVPRSVLIGAERGTLASAEEEAQSLKEKLQEREQDFAEPVLLRPLIDRLLPATEAEPYGLSALPVPANGYVVVWENQRALSEPQRAQVAKDKATAISQYDASRVATAHAGLPSSVPRQEFRETILNLPATSAYPDEPLPDVLPADATAESPQTPALPALGDQPDPGQAAA